VAAGVEDDDRPGRHRGQRRLHAGEIDAARGCVVVGVVLDREACRFEQGAVVFPARVADVDLGLGQQALQVIGADLERAGAAQAFAGDGAAGGEQFGILAEQQALHRVVVGGDAFDGLVAARRLGFQARLLGGLDRAQQGNLAVVTKIDADAEVDLVRVGVGIEGFVEAQDGVAGAISTAAKRDDMNAPGAGKVKKSALALRRFYVAAQSAQ
jgi:hypothetical protein